MFCPPVRGDNPRALASGLSPVQANKPWYYYLPFYITLAVKTLLSMKYFVLKFLISGTGDIKTYSLYKLVEIYITFFKEN